MPIKSFVKNILLISLSFLCLFCVARPKYESSPISSSLNVCELTKNISEYDDQRIRVEGEVKGFHQIVLYSPECPQDENLLLLDIGYSEFSSFSTFGNRALDNQVSGHAILIGKIKKNAGYLKDYGQFVSPANTFAPIETPRSFKVHKVMDITLESFGP